MKKYLILACLCINSVVGGQRWDDWTPSRNNKPFHERQRLSHGTESQQRSVFPSIVGRPRNSSLLSENLNIVEEQWSSVCFPKTSSSPSKEARSRFDCICTSDINSTIQKKKRLSPHDRTFLQSAICKKELYKRKTYYIIQQPRSYQYTKSPLTFDVYTEKDIMEHHIPSLTFDINRIFAKISLNDQKVPLNKKGDLFLEEEVVQTWDGNRQKGRDNKMDYLFSQDNEVYKE